MIVPVFFAIYKTAEFIEGQASETALKDYSKFLNGLQIENHIGGLPGIVLRTFNSVFGLRHLSWKCIKVSVLFSLCSLAILFLFSALYAPDGTISILKYIHHIKTPKGRHVGIELLAISVTACCVLDFLNVLKSRVVLEVLAVKSLTKRALFSVLIADFGFTIVGFLIGVQVVVTTYELLALYPLPGQPDTPHNFVIAVLVFWTFAGFGVIDFLLNSGFKTLFWGIPFGDFFWATTIASMWIWVHIIVSICTRVAQRYSPKIRSAINYFFDTEKHPIRTIGVIVASVTSLLIAIFTTTRLIIGP